MAPAVSSVVSRTFMSKLKGLMAGTCSGAAMTGWRGAIRVSISLLRLVKSEGGRLVARDMERTYISNNAERSEWVVRESLRHRMAGPGLAEINAFVAIAEQRSFAKAALRLGVSVSTLSENLRRLQDRLWVGVVM